MPECDGPTSTKLINEKLEEAQTTDQRPYICLLTAYNAKNFHQLGLDAGMDSYLVKPVFKD